MDLTTFETNCRLYLIGWCRSDVMCLSVCLSVCCLSKEDVVVGAPFYHAAGVGGAIYIYYNSAQVASLFSLCLLQYVRLHDACLSSMLCPSCIMTLGFEPRLTWHLACKLRKPDLWLWEVHLWSAQAWITRLLHCKYIIPALCKENPGCVRTDQWNSLPNRRTV